MKPSTEHVRIVLDATAERLAEPSSWTKGAWARDETGQGMLPVNSDKATCWCLTGAIFRTAWEMRDDFEIPYKVVATECVARLEKHLTTMLEYINDRDSTTHREIVDLLLTGKI